MTEKTSFKYVIVGNCAGGIGAAEAIREIDRSGSMAIVSDEVYPAYSRPLISEYLGERCSLERMLFRPASFYEDNGIHTFLGKEATELDVSGRSLTLNDGTVIGWEKLLLATGGRPFVPPTEGAEGPGVFTFTTLDDAKGIDDALEQGASRAVVIGGGLIGISASEALVKRGVHVSVVEVADRVLGLLLDETASALEASALEEHGVDVLTGHTVARIEREAPQGRITGVTLDDGLGIPCDIVIVAIGVRPRADLAAAAGIGVNRGILVDRSMMSSADSVYACGDAAEAYDFIHEERRVTPIWPNAYAGGRVAGFNMAGRPTEYEGGTAMNSIKYYGVAIHSAGIAAPAEDGYSVLASNGRGCYRKVVLKDGLVVGMVFAGDIERSGIVYSLMKDKVDVTEFADALIREDFGLASLPEEIWRARLDAPIDGAA